MSTIGLCMIVKNEAKVILKCLASTLPLVDYVLVVDTGSEDGTQEIIRGFLADHNVPGAVIEEPWRDFAYNRTFALDQLRAVEWVDYAMIIDADDELIRDPDFEPPLFKSQMEHDIYDVEISHGGTSFYRPQICRNALPFTFKSVLHEYLEAPSGSITRQNAHGFRIATGRGGARSQNPRKYQDDAAVLETALATEADPFLISRYTFYLAQSYRDCGEPEKALERYLQRADQGFWNEEVYVSLLEAGNLLAALDRPFEGVVSLFERATQTVPTRGEALHAASLYCRNQGRNAEGQEYARRGLDMAEPIGLFISPWVYAYGLLDEFSVNAYWAGAYRESLDACLKLLTSDKLPTDMVQRVAANARFAADKLEVREPPALGRLGAETLVKQHRLIRQRSLRSRLNGTPRVLIAILAKQKEPALPLYLECIEALDYPKESIVLYIRTNNNTDRTEHILREWVGRVGHLYSAVEIDASDVADRVEQFREHEWNETRFKVLGRIRDESLRKTLEYGCDFYFVVDVDNFVRPATLRELVSLDLPIVAPLLRSISPGQYYSNYHAEVDANGYYSPCDQYAWVLNRHVRGVIEMPLVHCTYLVRADVLNELTYEDGTSRYEYVIFAESARKSGIVQYLDNRQVYGYITFGDHEYHVSGGIDRARELLHDAEDTAILPGEAPAASKSPPIYLINLDRSTERLAEFRQRNAHLREVIRFPAIDGRMLDRESLVADSIVTRDCTYTAGALGCGLSHIALWKKAIGENRTISIAEDDAVFSRHFDGLSTRLMESLSGDWDIIVWGFIFQTYVWADLLPQVSQAKIQTFEDQLQGNIDKYQPLEIRPTLMRLRHLFGTPCYSVTPQGARALLDACLPFDADLIDFPGLDIRTPNEGIDCAMNKIYHSINSFVCIPPLVVVENRAETSLTKEA